MSNIPGFTTVTCPKCKRSWRLRDWTVSFNMKSHEETCRELAPPTLGGETSS